MGITTTGILPPPVQAAFDIKLLSRPAPYLIHNKFAMQKSLSSRNGNILRMRRYNRLNLATTPIGPAGITPPAQQLSAVDIDAQIQWYGSLVIITDQVTLINQDPVLNEGASVLSQNLRETEDALTRNMLQGTASSINCTSGINGDNPTNMTREDIDGVVRTLLGANARKISGMIGAQNKFGTTAVREAYWAMMHTDLIRDLEAVDGFTSIAQYPLQGDILSSELGAVGNMRFTASSQGSLIANGSGLGNDLYNVFVTAEEAYCCVDLEDANAEFIYNPPGSGDDALRLRQSIGYKFAEALKITNDAWLINMRCSLGV